MSSFTALHNTLKIISEMGTPKRHPIVMHILVAGHHLKMHGKDIFSILRLISKKSFSELSPGIKFPQSVYRFPFTGQFFNWIGFVFSPLIIFPNVRLCLKMTRLFAGAFLGCSQLACSNGNFRVPLTVHRPLVDVRSNC